MLRLIGMGAAPSAMMGIALGLLLQPDYSARRPMTDILLSQAVGYEAGPPPVVTTYLDKVPPLEPAPPLAETWLAGADSMRISADAVRQPVVFQQAAWLDGPQAPSATVRGVEALAYSPQAPWPEPKTSVQPGVATPAQSAAAQTESLETPLASPAAATLPPEASTS